VFAAKTDTRRIGTNGSRADYSALGRPSQLHEFVTCYITRSARIVYTRLKDRVVCRTFVNAAMNVRCEVSETVTMKITPNILWNVMSCSLVQE
jgi:hypothetical protein